MKKPIILILMLINGGLLLAQSYLPTPSFSLPEEVKITAFLKLSPPLIELVAQVQVPKGSHIYSVNSQNGILPTSLEAHKDSGLTPSSKTVESEPERIFDEALQKNIIAHKGVFELRRNFQMPQKPLTGRQRFFLNYQICDQRVCSLPRESHFEVVGP